MIRRVISVAIVGVVVAAVSAVFASPALATGGYNEIMNQGSRLCIEVDRFGSPSLNGALIVQRACDASPYQEWTQVDTASGIHEFVNQYSGYCLDDTDGINADSNPVQQWQCRGSNSMKWAFQSGPLPSFNENELVNRAGGRCLDVRAGSNLDGAQIQIYHCSGFNNLAQIWTFQ